MKKSLTLLGLFLCIQAYAGIGDTFNLVIDGNKEVTFKVTNDDEVQVGDGTNIAVANTISGYLTIPSSVVEKGVTYKVTAIGREAFKDCKSLEYVIIPNSVIEIGWGAFYGSGLTSITIPNSVKYLDDEVCCECSNLVSATIGDGVTAIGWSAFRLCSNLTQVNIGRNVKCIGGYSFAWCKLSDITIPNSVTEIGDYAFSGCKLTAIDIPDGVKRIGEFAFRSCTYLASVTIPNSVETICRGAFQYSKWDSNLPEGMNYAGLVAYKYKGTIPADDKIEIKEGTKGIGGDAFSNYNIYSKSNLTSITIPSSVISIAGQAFYGCSDLDSIDIPNSVTTIGADAFYGTKWYKNQADGIVYAGLVAYKYKGELPDNGIIELKEGTTGIAEEAFQNCSLMTSVTIPNGVKNIGAYAFDGCSEFASLTIPNSVESIGYFAFQHSPATNLTSVYVEWNTPILLDSSVFFDGNDSYRGQVTLYVPTGTKAAYENAQYWKEFKEIVEYSVNDIKAVSSHRHNTANNAAAYSIDGKAVLSKSGDKLPKGLWIKGNKKVIVK